MESVLLLDVNSVSQSLWLGTQVRSGWQVSSQQDTSQWQCRSFWTTPQCRSLKGDHPLHCLNTRRCRVLLLKLLPRPPSAHHSEPVHARGGNCGLQI